MFARTLLVIALLFPVVAVAQPADPAAVTAPLDAGSASAPAPAKTCADGELLAVTHDGAPVCVRAAAQLHDPVSSPGGSWDDLKAARKVGWPLAVFVVLIALCKLAARLGGKWKLLGAGKVAVVIGAVGAVAASCYNAAADGGAWTATLMAGAGALLHYLDAGGKTEA